MRGSIARTGGFDAAFATDPGDAAEAAADAAGFASDGSAFATVGSLAAFVGKKLAAG